MQRKGMQIKLLDFFLMYQPIVSLNNNKIEVINFEVFLRSNESIGFPQKQFKSVVKDDQTNEIFLEWFFNEVKKVIQSKQNKIFCINLDPQQCLYPSTIRILKKMAYLKKNLQIEITERSAGKDTIIQLKEKLKAIKKLDYKIALDDVSECQNTLSFVLENIKFINRIKLSLLPFRSKDIDYQMLLVKFWSVIAQEFNIEFVVEGMHTKQMAELIWNNGGKIQQGFFWGAPERF